MGQVKDLEFTGLAMAMIASKSRPPAIRDNSQTLVNEIAIRDYNREKYHTKTRVNVYRKPNTEVVVAHTGALVLKVYARNLSNNTAAYLIVIKIFRVEIFTNEPNTPRELTEKKPTI